MNTVWAETALLPTGWASGVRVDIDASGQIIDVQKNVPAVGEQTPFLLPSPVNAHSHAFQRAMAGLTERRGPNPNDSFWTWRQLMYRFLDQLTPEHVEAITAFVQMEMLEAGYAANTNSTTCTTNLAVYLMIILLRPQNELQQQLIKLGLAYVYYQYTMSLVGVMGVHSLPGRLGLAMT